jgi:hypothetical protein
MAFGLLNPMLPPEHQHGVVDDFIQQINRGRPHSLLRNPRRYTVLIATFTGDVVFGQGSSVLDKLPSNNQRMSRLEMGERAAVELCKTLRAQGIEAYEYHDRSASIVTVGSFDQLSHPQIQHIIQQYQGTVVRNPQPQVQGFPQQHQGQVARRETYNPVIINGIHGSRIECDLQPRVIEVPRVRR